ncbi:MAG TPA: hypothetical protein VL727_24545 [Puia sp.]|nr:hypothetical protein [Puia sp.]
MTDHKNKQGSTGNDKKQSGTNKDSKNVPHKHPEKANRMDSDDTDESKVRKGADIENPDLPGPDKKIELDDNPDETKRKIPNM